MKNSVIVVGAGIIGCAVARELAVRGAACTVIDDRPIGGGATQASAGMLAPYVEAHERGPLLDLAKLPNVYVRTSLHNPSKTKEMPYRDVWPFLRRMYDRFGPRRMVWANFFEYQIMKEMIPFFTAEDKEWILGRTAHRLYRFGRAAG